MGPTQDGEGRELQFCRKRLSLGRESCEAPEQGRLRLITLGGSGQLARWVDGGLLGIQRGAAVAATEAALGA